MQQTPQNIIVRMPNWLGDVVMATPILHDLRNKFPTAKITAMCQGHVGTLLKYDLNINEIMNFTKPSGWIHRSVHNEIFERLTLGSYDAGILLTNSFSSAWWFWRGNVLQRIGFEGNFRSLLLTSPVKLPKKIEQQHLVSTYKLLLSPLGIPISHTLPKLYLTDEEKFAAENLLARCDAYTPHHRIIGINPGAAYGSAKCWPPNYFEGVCKKLLSDPSIFILFFGDQKGEPLVSSICKNFPQRVINLAAKTTIRELMALINRCDVILSNDSGPMHIAAALAVPVVAIFGSTNAVKTGPLGTGKITIITKNVECSPCYKRECPIDFRCMTRISVDEVYEAIISLLQNSIATH